MRHPRIGSAGEAAEVANAPVLNGGDGAGQHPTQALLDLYTIRQERGKVDGNTIVLVGDLKNGRTVHAGVEIYKHYDCKLICVAPEALRMPAEVVERLRGRGFAVEETDSLEAALPKADVLYMTRIQKERFADVGGVRTAEGRVHPEPRDDRAPAARRRRCCTRCRGSTRSRPTSTACQTRPISARRSNGVFVRMALLALVLGAE